MPELSSTVSTAPSPYHRLVQVIQSPENTTPAVSGIVLQTFEDRWQTKVDPQKWVDICELCRYRWHRCCWTPLERQWRGCWTRPWNGATARGWRSCCWCCGHTPSSCVRCVPSSAICWRRRPARCLNATLMHWLPSWFTGISIPAVRPESEYDILLEMNRVPGSPVPRHWFPTSWNHYHCRQL